jgi:hypothetical protein
VKVAAGLSSAMALRNDGTLVVWGSNTLGMVSSMPTQAGFTDIPNIYNDTGIGLRDVDCNGNGVLDALDIANGFSFDCNQNGTPDECELLNPLLDLNQNGILDACEPDSGLSESHGMAYVHTSVLAGLPIVPPGPAEAVFDGYPGGLVIPINVLNTSTSFVLPPLTMASSTDVTSDFYVRWIDATGTHTTPVFDEAFTWQVPRIVVVTPPAVPVSQNKLVQIILTNNFVQSGIGTARFGDGQEVAAIAAVVAGQTVVTTVATAQVQPGNYPVELRFDPGGIIEYTRVETGALVHLAEGITSMSRIWGDQAGGDTVDFELSGFQPNHPITVAFGNHEVVGMPTGFSALAQLTVESPASLVDGNVNVRLSQDNAQLGVKVAETPNAWFYDGPEIFVVSPNQDQMAGGKAAAVSVDGFGLGALDVHLGSAFAPGLVTQEGGQQVARFVVPPGLEAGVVDLRLVQGVYDVVLKDAFTYLPPAVTGVNPPAGAWYNGHTLLVETVGFNPNVSTQVAIGDSAPQPANFVDPNTLRVSVPAGTVVGAGVQPIKVTQGPLLSVLKGAWTSLPDLALLPAGSAASGGSVAIRVRAEGPGTAWVLAAGAVVATPVPLFGVHYGLVLDANVGHVIGKVSLSGAVPTATYPFGPGVLQPGTTLYVQVLVVESPLTGGTELSFTNVESVTIP